MLTVNEAAQLARVQPRTIREAIQRGDLQAVRPRGVRRILIPRAAMDAWLEPVTVEATPAHAPTPSRSVGSRDRLRRMEEGY